MTDQGKDPFWDVEYKRTSNDFHFRRLEQSNCSCSICHGIGAVIEFQYVTRNYQSPRTKKICKTLQAHGHSFWICRKCIDNLVNASQGLVDILVKENEDG